MNLYDLNLKIEVEIRDAEQLKVRDLIHSIEALQNISEMRNLALRDEIYWAQLEYCRLMLIKALNQS